MNKGWTGLSVAGSPLAGRSADEIRILKEAAALDPAFAAKLGLDKLATGAVDDYQVTEFIFGDVPLNPKPGDDVFVDIIGSVFDQYAGLPDAWQIVVAVAAVDGFGNPDPSLRTFNVFKSATNGLPEPYSNHIKIADAFNAAHSHMVLGKMGSSTLYIKAQLFANHSDSPEWDWSLWLQAAP